MYWALLLHYYHIGYLLFVIYLFCKQFTISYWIQIYYCLITFYIIELIEGIIISLSLYEGYEFLKYFIIILYCNYLIYQIPNLHYII